MNTVFDHIKMKEELTQSKLFGAEYSDIFDTSNSYAYSNPNVSDVEDILNNILVTYNGLTTYQIGVLVSVFEQFKYIREVIDPNRLKAFKHSINDDGELLLYRKTDEGLINIIINEEECTAFSFISNNNAKEDVLQFYHENASDYQNLCLEFLSRG